MLILMRCNNFGCAYYQKSCPPEIILKMGVGCVVITLIVLTGQNIVLQMETTLKMGVEFLVIILVVLTGENVNLLLETILIVVVSTVCTTCVL